MQCPNSAILLFPEEIYKSVGSSVVLPQLLEVVPPEKLAAVQFLRNGAVRLTFKRVADCEHLVLRGITYGDTPLRVVSADTRSRIVYLRDCPAEVSDDAVKQFFSSFGEVHAVQRSSHAAFPALLDGNRVVRISLTQDIPSTIRVSGFDCRVWYARQPAQCTICNNVGHRNRNCPLSGLCRRCRQPGHKARECTQAWGSTRTFDPVPADERTEVLVSDVIPENVPDNSPDFVPSGDESPDESDMASADEEVIAEAEPPPPSRRPVDPPVVVDPPVDQSSAVPRHVRKPSVSFADVPVDTPDADPPTGVTSAPVPVSSPSPIFIKLKAAATKDVRLRRTLERYGHVVTEKLLQRIPQDLPFCSEDYVFHLNQLADQRLAHLERIEELRAFSSKR